MTNEYEYQYLKAKEFLEADTDRKLTIMYEILMSIQMRMEILEKKCRQQINK